MKLDLLELAIGAAKHAGNAIMACYSSREHILNKADGSPLTVADLAAHKAISEALHRAKIPVVSEECDDLMPDATRYWLVDPLDGTKDYLAGNNEFTVNIALIEAGEPAFGVIYAPALDELYWGGPKVGAWCQLQGSASQLCIPTGRSEKSRLATSRFHDHPDTGAFATANGIDHRIAIGSALKFGRLACAKVDVYPRFAGSSEWDIAAGQAILEGAQGHVVEMETGATLRYGKIGRRNPCILAMRAPYTYSEFAIPDGTKGNR